MPGSYGVVVAVAPGLDAKKLKAMFPPQWQVKFIDGDTYNALAAADLAIVSSGTATVETALLGKPMIVVYRLRSEEHTSELQSLRHLVCRLLLEKKKNIR